MQTILILSILVPALIIVVDMVADYRNPPQKVDFVYNATMSELLKEQARHIDRIRMAMLSGALIHVNKVNSRAWSIELAKAKLSYTSACKALGYLSRNKRTIERNKMLGQVNRLRTTIRELEMIGV